MDRISVVFPPVCLMCGGQMRLIAFITEGMEIRKILQHIAVDAQAPAHSPPAASPLGAAVIRRWARGVEVQPHWLSCSVVLRHMRLELRSFRPRHRLPSLI